MSTKLFVRGLPWATDGKALQEAFEQFGTVSDAVVVTDRETGRSRGFGFVTFEADAEAQEAMRQMDGATLGGRTIQVKEAEDRRRGPGGPGGPGGGGGPRRDSRGGPPRGNGPPGRSGGPPGRSGGPPRPGGPPRGDSRGGPPGGPRGGGGGGGWSPPPSEEDSWAEDRQRRRTPTKKKTRREEEADPRIRSPKGRKPRGGGGSKRVRNWDEDEW